MDDEAIREKRDQRARDELEHQIDKKRYPYAIALVVGILVTLLGNSINGGGALWLAGILILVGSGAALWSMRKATVDLHGLTDQKKSQLGLEKTLRENKATYDYYTQLGRDAGVRATRAMRHYDERVERKFDEKLIKVCLIAVMCYSVFLHDSVKMEEAGRSEDERAGITDTFLAAIAQLYTNDMAFMMANITNTVAQHQIEVEAAVLYLMFANDSETPITKDAVAENVAFLKEAVATYDLAW